MWSAVAVFVPATLLWVLSLRLRDVSIVDIFWGPAFLLAGLAAAAEHGAGPRAPLLLALTGAWALRLAGYLAWRNLGKGEDRRYAAMRARRPGFAARSLVLVFWLQAALAWVISQPVQQGVVRAEPLGPVAALGVALWLVGFTFEAVGDLQLARFKADPANAGHVMDRGLWRWTRHPNYFGDFCVWWGLWLVSGAAWTVFAPVLMSWLLLRVSGVSLLERTIGDRRPAYAAYVARTSAFFPWPPRRPG